MTTMKNILMTGCIAWIVFGCKIPSEKIKVSETSQQTDVTNIDPSGDYVSDGYEKRKEGYDWVAVSVRHTSDSSIHVAVRSRADKKKPTCTFDADAVAANDTTYKASVEGKNILFVFTNDNIVISTENEEDKYLLNYYCSGGGSLADSYKKIHEPLDEKQLDPTVFGKTLSLQDIGFEVKTTGRGSIQQLSIQPYGLKKDNREITMEVIGVVTNAEIEDMNSDGFPELLIYTTSAGSGSYGDVIGFSVNNGKSISRITFPGISENPKASKGYRGHDEFALLENTLVQRFRTYNTEDTNSNPTGVIRQIHYKLVDGEASRKFVVSKIIEYPAEPASLNRGK